MTDRWNDLVELSNRRATQALIAVVSVAVIAYLFYRDFQIGVYRIPYTDFQSFYMAALAVRHHADPYGPAVDWIRSYVASGNGSLFATKSYVYAPFFALLLSPLTFLSMHGALVVWDVLNVAFLVGAVYSLLRSAGVRTGLPTVLALAAAASLWAAVRKEWYLGQSDVFLLFLLSTALWARTAGRGNVAGVLLGAAIAVKPAFAVLLPFLLWKREFRFALAGAGTAVALLAVPALWLGPATAAHQLQVWSFWSGPYVAFAHNDAPKGILTRLFTVNPVSPSLMVAPGLVTAAWLIISAAVAVVAAAVIRPAPFQRDARSLIEFGLMVEALLLITPLTEWPYLLLLLIPLLGIFAWLMESGINSRPARIAAVGAVAVAALLYGPANAVEYWALGHVGGTPVHSAVYVVLAGANLYLLAGAFAVQLVALNGLSRTSTRVATLDFVSHLPSLLRDWLADALSGRAPAPRHGTAIDGAHPATGRS
ncbi:MAG TPA: glycosyltransferase family 87 protein [Candidatus Acidoferrum sp.]|nr:glycosyltransferase family 87 protein [Candidatus Acidoferrum sp.]